MIDLHCHMHAGVDDGPTDEAESLALARALVAAGVTTAALTSHVRPDKGWINDKRADGERLDKVRAMLERADVKLDVVSGAEHYIDPQTFGAQDWPERVVPYGKSRWLLVETPYLGEPPNLLELLASIRRRGFRVLLAHVERFGYLSDNLDKCKRLTDAGLVLQVNLGSLAGAYNKAQQKNAERVLKAGLAGVLAGDCHREQDVADNIVAGTKAAHKLVGAEVVKKLTHDAPKAILDDAAPERVWP
jgi:protein-tyrosine phosphatase